MSDTDTNCTPPPDRGERDAGDKGGEERAEGEEAGDPSALVAVEAVVAPAVARDRLRVADDGGKRRRRPAEAVAEAEGAEARANRRQDLRQLRRVVTCSAARKLKLKLARNDAEIQ